jgi:hypothetical protein
VQRSGQPNGGSRTHGAPAPSLPQRRTLRREVDAPDLAVLLEQLPDLNWLHVRRNARQVHLHSAKQEQRSSIRAHMQAGRAPTAGRTTPLRCSVSANSASFSGWSARGRLRDAEAPSAGAPPCSSSLSSMAASVERISYMESHHISQLSRSHPTTHPTSDNSESHIRQHTIHPPT